MWNFKSKDDGLIYIENISKAKFLGTTIDGNVVLEDFEENKAGQLWKKGIPNSEGYFTLTNGLKGFYDQSFLTFPACFSIPIIFSYFNLSFPNLSSLRNLQEQVKKAFCYQELF